MSTLPTEILCKILSYLVTNKDMESIRNTCRKFRNICDKYGYIRHMRLDNYFTNIEYMRYMSQKQALCVLEIDNIPPDEYEIWFSDHRVPIVKYRWAGETRIIRCNA